jgi:hypothetical protein
MNPKLTLVALLTVLTIGPACGGDAGSGQPTPTPCSTQSDNVSVQSAVISIANISATPSSCQIVAEGTNISASNGGIAETRFGGAALCNFYQLQPATAGATPKTAYYTTRPVGGGLFHVDNGEADCTLVTGSPVNLCGQGTLFPDGTQVGVHIDCNLDPVVNVGVYRGSVKVTLNGAPQPFQIGFNQALSANPPGGKVGPAQFTPQQKSLFDVQLDSLLTGVSSTNATSLLKAVSLTPSGNVVAPNALQTYLGKEYGLVRSMCAAASVPVVFYPTNPYGSTPVLYGGLCTAKAARVYGLAIYRPDKLTYGGGQLFSEAGGSLVKNEIFTDPKTLEFGASLQMFTWKGDLGWVSPAAGTSAPSPGGQASTDIYVAKFLYDLPPDTTPRIGLIAMSYGGASFPPIIR